MLKKMYINIVRCTERMKERMIITTTQLRKKLNEYLDLSKTEDVYVMRKGKIIAKITNPYADKLGLLRSLKGSLSLNMSEEGIVEGRTQGS